MRQHQPRPVVPPEDAEPRRSPGSIAATTSPLPQTGRWVSSPWHLREEGLIFTSSLAVQPLRKQVSQ